MMTTETRFGGNAPGLPGLPPPAPLPGLVGTFSRRAALFGAVASTGFLTAASARLVATIGGVEVGSANARLIAIADELHGLEVTCNAHAALNSERETDLTEAEFSALTGRFTPLEEEMAELPADTLAGVLAKVRALEISTCAACESGIADSVCADIRRLHAAGRLS